MSTTTKIVYWGALDEKTDLTTGLCFLRGIAIEVPFEFVARFLGSKPKKFFPEGTECPAHLAEAYLSYPDREIANHREHADTYRMVAWQANGTDEEAKARNRQGALDEVAAIEARQADFELLKQARVPALAKRGR